MPSFIVKLTDEGRDYYMEWSTVVDAPTTYGMPLDEFKEHYRERYGSDGMRGLPERLARVEAKGTSEVAATCVDDTIGFNRAGPKEEQITKEQIVEKYIRHRPTEDDECGIETTDEGC